MPGVIKAKERAALSLTTTGASLTTGSAAATGTNFDARAAGNADNDFGARFELVAQFATVTGIVAGTIVAELYLVPAIDGTNFADVDTAAGTSRMPFATLVGVFEAPKAPVAATNMRFISAPGNVDPVLYKPYLKNVAGQTMSVNWSLTAVSAQGQYT